MTCPIPGIVAAQQPVGGGGGRGALPAWSSVGTSLSTGTMPGSHTINVPAHSAGDLLYLEIKMQNSMRAIDPFWTASTHRDGLRLVVSGAPIRVPTWYPNRCWLEDWCWRQWRRYGRVSSVLHLLGGDLGRRSEGKSPPLYGRKRLRYASLRVSRFAITGTRYGTSASMPSVTPTGDHELASARWVAPT